MFSSSSEDLSVKEFVQRKSKALFLNLESQMLNNWVWGPRQNREAAKSVVKPISRDKFDTVFKTKMVKDVLISMKDKIRKLLKPNLIVKRIEDFVDDLVTEVTDERLFEGEYAFNQEVLKDFNFNVERKLHMLKVALKVRNYVYIATLGPISEFQLV